MKQFFLTGKLFANLLLTGLLLMSSGGLAFGQGVLEPTEMWEGSLDYAATGASQLADNCSMVVDPITFTPYCAPYPNPNGVPDYQGDQLINESTAFLKQVPTDAGIVAAYLIWMGSLNRAANEQPDSEVLFKPPAAQDFYTVRSTNPAVELEEVIYSEMDTTFGMEDFRYYTYRVDITDIMTEHVQQNQLPINGPYKVEGIYAYGGDPYILHTTILAGWSLLIVYQHPSIARKRFYWYTGFEKLADQEILMHPSGFETPEDPLAKVTFFLGEGDSGISGTGLTGTHMEGLYFNGEALGDVCNPFDNVYNSTVNTNLPTDEQPCRTNQYSIDLDNFVISDLLNLGDSSAEIKLSVGQDQIFTNYLVLSIDTKLPSFDIPGIPEKYSGPGDGGYVSPGEVYYYEIWVQNCGEDSATNVTVQDSIDRYVEYVPGTTSIDGTVIDDLPEGAFPFSIPYKVADQMYPGVGSRKVLRYAVRLLDENQGVTKLTVVKNVGVIMSDEGEEYETNGGIPVTQRVRLESYEGDILVEPGPLNPPGNFVMPGDSVALAQVRLTAKNQKLRLESIAFDSVTPERSAPLAEAGLYWDDDENADPTGDTAILEGFSPFGSVVIESVGLAVEMQPNESKMILLVGKVSGDLSPGAGFGVGIFEGGIGIRGRDVNGLPFESGVFRVPEGELLLELGERTGVDRPVIAGSKETALQLKATTFAGANTLESLTVSIEGTLMADEITEVVLWSDVNGDGNWLGESQLGSAAISGSSMEFSGLGLTIGPGQPAYVGVAFTFDPEASHFSNTRAVVNEGAAVFQTGTPEFSTTPIKGPILTISAYEIDGDADSDLDGGGSIEPNDHNGQDDKSIGSGGVTSGGCSSGGAAGLFAFLFFLISFRLFRQTRFSHGFKTIKR